MAAPKTVLCPTCRRETPWGGNPNRPFCCARCRMTDLGNWAAEHYRIPAGPVTEEAEDDDAAED